MGFETAYILNKQVPVEVNGNNIEENFKVKASTSSRVINLVSPVVKLDTPTYDGSGQSVHPSVVYIKNSFGGFKYWMAMTPYPETNDDFENPSILASNDGVTWVVPNGLTNPIVAPLASPQWNYDPELLFDGSKLIMYWGDSTGKRYRKTSSDGFTWTSSTQLTFRTAGVSFWDAPGIVRESETLWKAWGGATGAINAVNTGYLSYFESTDGFAWDFVKSVPTNLKVFPWHISVYSDETGYHFIVAAYPKGKGNGDCSIYYGYSVDGEEITFELEPILSPETSGWTSGQIYRSCLVKGDDQTLNLYISAQSGKKWYIGMTKVRLNDPSRLISYGTIMPRPKIHKRWLWKNKEIRDTVAFSSSNHIYDLERYANKILLIRSSHDQPVTLSIASTIRGLDVAFYGDPGVPANGQNFIITSNKTYLPFMLGKEHLPMLGVPIPLGVIQLKAGTAPTVGSIDIMLIAW